MYGVARDPLEDETPRERELFGQALSVAVATAVAANASEVEAEARIRERRQGIRVYGSPSTPSGTVPAGQ